MLLDVDTRTKPRIHAETAGSLFIKHISKAEQREQACFDKRRHGGGNEQPI